MEEMRFCERRYLSFILIMLAVAQYLGWQPPMPLSKPRRQLNPKYWATCCDGVDSASRKNAFPVNSLCGENLILQIVALFIYVSVFANTCICR